MDARVLSDIPSIKIETISLKEKKGIILEMLDNVSPI
jgi:hypothetical protein